MTPETDIQSLTFFPADHATVSEGKLYVNGGCWDKLQLPSFPQMVPLSVVAVLFIPYRAYHQDHGLMVDLEDADGNPMSVHVEGTFRVGTKPEMRVGDPTVMPMAVPVNSMAFERPGDYSFVLRVDGTEIARYAIRAVQIVLPTIAGGSPPQASSEPPGEE